MANNATFTCDQANEFSRVRVNGVLVATLLGPSFCSRASAAALALNTAFLAGDDFEFCTPSWWSSTAPYAVVTVKSAKRADPSTWYRYDKRFILAATSYESTYPWWTALRWAKNIRGAIAETVTTLYLPPNYGTTNDGSAYVGRKGSNYGCGESLNPYTANTEFFHCCDLTVAINHQIYVVPDDTSRWVRVTFPEKGTTAVLRVNDVGPADSTGRQIDLTCRGST